MTPPLCASRPPGLGATKAASPISFRSAHHAGNTLWPPANPAIPGIHGLAPDLDHARGGRRLLAFGKSA
eukprot:2084639-Lingulodinium_polyedra.AAC.1